MIAPLHEHCVTGFTRAAERILADPNLSSEDQAAELMMARVLYGWTVDEVWSWLLEDRMKHLAEMC